MTTPYDGPSRYYWPIIIDSTNNSFVFKQDGTTNTIKISEGTYWAVQSQSGNDFTGLLGTITDAIQSSFGNANDDYLFVPNDIGEDIANSSVSLKDTSSSHSFELIFEDPNNAGNQNPNFTLDPGYFGFPSDITTNQSSSNDTIDGTISLKGKWQTPKTRADGRREPRNDIFSSHEGPNATQNAYIGYDVRSIKYHKIAAAHIFKGRARESDYANDAGLVDGDENNTFEALYEGFRRGDVIALYGKGDDDTNDSLNNLNPEVWTTETGGVSRDRAEALRMLEGQSKKFKDHLGRVFKYPSEFYDVIFEAVITDSKLPGYAH